MNTLRHQSDLLNNMYCLPRHPQRCAATFKVLLGQQAVNLSEDLCSLMKKLPHTTATQVNCNSVAPFSLTDPIIAGQNRIWATFYLFATAQIDCGQALRTAAISRTEQSYAGSSSTAQAVSALTADLILLDSSAQPVSFHFTGPSVRPTAAAVSGFICVITLKISC